MKRMEAHLSIKLINVEIRFDYDSDGGTFALDYRIQIDK